MASIGHNGGPDIDDTPAFPDREGFIAVARSMRDHWLVGFGSEGRYSKAEAWQDLIMECRYEPGKIMNGGKPMLLKPGQLIGAVSYLASRWNWTPKQVRVFLDKLEAEGMITLDYGTYADPEHVSKQGTEEGKHRGKQAKVLTVCKYDIYQLGWRVQGQTKGQSEGQIKGKQGANEGQQSNKGIKEEDTPPTPSRGGKKRIQLPSYWSPNYDWVRGRWVASDKQISEEAEKFRDYHTAKGSQMKDWDAAWRTWWQNGYHGLPRRTTHHTNGHAHKPDELDLLLDVARQARGL